jgi:hypothetical protein
VEASPDPQKENTMYRTLRTLVPMACITVALTAPAAVAQERTVDGLQDVIGSCGPGDALVADFTIRQQVGDYGDREQLHLHLTGTITRTGTGVVGRYAETQLDKFGADGSEIYSGTLSRLVVPGAGVVRAAGHAVFSAESADATPGLAVLMDEGFTDRLCELLG